MQVKKFEAPTMQEALNLVKTELGPEAIILSTKNHRKGFGLLSKASVEVTAAVSDKALNKKQVTERVVPGATRQAIEKLSASKQAELYDDFTDHVRKRIDERKPEQRQSDARQQSQARAAAAQAALRMPDRSGMDALLGGAQSYALRPSPGGGAFAAANNATAQASAKRTLAQNEPPKGGSSRYIDITDDEDDTPPAQAAASYGRNARVQRTASQAAAAPEAENERLSSARQSSYEEAPVRQPGSARFIPPPDAPPDEGSPRMQGLQDDIQRLKSMLEELKSEQTTLSDSRIPEVSSEEVQSEYNNLLRNGIDKRFATPLIKQVAFAIPREALSESGKIVEALAVEMMSNLKVEHPLDYRGGTGPRVFALVGPTGVGKTTTIAKLASQAILQKNLRVGLINVDSYKVAALDQLATYAKILNVPFRQASNAVELDRALQEFKPLDLVLIDTSGRSQRDSDSLTQMKQLLSECAAVRPLLIMSATTRDQELYDIITRFKIFNPTGLVFSKLDETSTFGCIYNVAVKTNLPLTYFTVGQRVPEDLEPASRERVADLILDL